MKSLRRRRQERHGSPDGFSLTQLSITVAIISILSGITISNSLTSWHDAQAAELALQLAGWLEQISRAPEVIPEVNGQKTCTVTFASGITGGITLNNGAELASVSPTSCSPEPTFRVPTRFGAHQISAGASAASVVFTPRTAITSTTDIQVRLAVLDQAPVRCVRLSAVLGLLRIGRNDASTSTTTNCPAASFDSI
jgi:Tfp pilus assembly protein FimT